MWAILRHAAGVLARNFATALRLSLGPLVILAVLNMAMSRLTAMGAASPVPFGDATGWLLGLMNAVIVAWLAVAWHRYVLREEAPTGLLPPLLGQETMGYVGWTFLLGLTFLVLTWALGPVLAPLFRAGLTGALLAQAIPVGLVAWLGFRLGLALPAAALGRPMTIVDSWAVTRPVAPALAGRAALAALWAVLAPFALVLAADLPGWAVTAWGLAVAWASLMLGLSVLTTLYGHLVERRPLR